MARIGRVQGLSFKGLRDPRFLVSRTKLLVEDEEPPVAGPLLSRVEPLGAQATPGVDVVQAKVATVAVGVRPELAGRRKWHVVVERRARERPREVDELLRAG